MNSKRAIIFNLRFFLGTTFLLALFCALVLLSSDKETIHFTINSYHSTFWDFFFRYFTYVGDGLFVALAGILIAVVKFKQYRWSPLLFGASVLILSGALAQIFKRYVFENALRPNAFFKENTLYLVDGVQMHASHSFPSGHTTAGFAFFGFAALFLAQKKPFLQVLFALLAGLIGYSRMYLSQHFLEDVFAGIILGSFCMLLLVLLIPIRKK